MPDQVVARLSQAEALRVLTEVSQSVAAAAESMAEIAEGLTAEVDRTRRLMVPLLLGIFVLIVIALSNLLLVVETRRSSEQIFDCTNETGECYQRNAQHTGELIGFLVRDGQTHEDHTVARLQCFEHTGEDCPTTTTTTTPP